MLDDLEKKMGKGANAHKSILTTNIVRNVIFNTTGVMGGDMSRNCYLFT